jgi:hypothetical protein
MYRPSINSDKRLILIPRGTVLNASWDSGVISDFTPGMPIRILWNITRADNSIDEAYVLFLFESDDATLFPDISGVDCILPLIGSPDIQLRDHIASFFPTKKYIIIYFVISGTAPYLECSLELIKGV